MRQVDSGQLAAAGQPHSVVAAIGAEADEYKVEHLGKGQGDHDEGNALSAQSDSAGDEPDQPASQHSDQQVGQHVFNTMHSRNGGAVDTQAQEQGVAEADHAAVAQHQVQRHGSNSQDDDAAHERQRKGVLHHDGMGR